MHLLEIHDDNTLSLARFSGNRIPPYAILSHTWGMENEEVTFQDIMCGSGSTKAGYAKILFCRDQAKQDNLEYFWVDSCCIDRSSSQELSEAINSMFNWYKSAERCYVFLSDVSNSAGAEDDTHARRWKSFFKTSRWFTRGWTLQELIAPRSVEFFSKEGIRLGDKQSLAQTIHEITKIAIDALWGGDLSQFSNIERFSWAEGRETTREEDAAYCLLGIFDVQMPLLYSEGKVKAMKRLIGKTKKSSTRSTSPIFPGERQKLLEKRQELLASLRFDQIYARQTTIQDAHSTTCQWLLSKPEYKKWLDPTKSGEHHGFFWIKGHPGTGKSTLMKFAVEHVGNSLTDKITISFFFNARGAQLEKSTTGAYRSILLQLLERLPRLQNVFDSIPHSTVLTKYPWDLVTLQRLLRECIRRLDGTSVICFIDALDECEEQQVRDMISFFESVGEIASKASLGHNFHICFSSRHYPHITIKKSLELILSVQAEHNLDISNFIECELKIGSGRIAQQIRSILQEKASGIFMWVVLVVRILNKEHDSGRPYALKRRLREIPASLHDLFRDIIMRDSNDRKELALCVQWILFAARPLRPEELFFAVLSELEPEILSTLDPADYALNVTQKFITNASKGLAEVTTSNFKVVQFIHESVKDFLLKEGLENIWPELGSNIQGQSHERLKQCCLGYMGIEDITHGLLPKCDMLSNLSLVPGLRNEVTDGFPFLEYAAGHFLYHADAAELFGVSQKSFIRNRQITSWIRLHDIYPSNFAIGHTPEVTLLYLLAEHNLSNLIKLLAIDLASECLDVGKERYGPPLFAAVVTSSNDVVDLFLESLAVSQHCSITPHNTERGYHKEEWALQAMGHDFQFPHPKTVLCYLSELGDSAMLSLLLERTNLEPDEKDQGGQTPLLWAVEKGHEEIVKLLLSTKKVDVDWPDANGQTPLSWAAEKGHEEIARLLLKTSAVRINSNDQFGWTPLSWAARNGHEGVVKLLLETHKCCHDLKLKDEHTPLWWAERNGQHNVAKLLKSHSHGPCVISI
ncbi:hypothetical protein HBI56_087340 [Parastagonospora nodorum]|nr:hypothetical protein HBH53_067810 [Parastagonospora nodorum]KAH3974286.1 hypothetical protein HBH51_090410 [Parastagonospora nodorum]KAH3979098.1 hypothetical protein HBH52_098410 [Parastagonospora nodorum]KAH3999402.1 hypothetical protein HBI10_115100 [Parastagonospora nodorum]KAH4013207.1 hypothetical protein HBI13_181150 [Parastagonospora nodorum]